MKRKQGPGELRSNHINMNIGKHNHKFPMFGVQKIQPFFPPIETLFKTEVLDRPLEYGIKFPDPVVSITDHTIKTLSGKEIETHPKITMLLSPFKWMKGEHSSLDLPTITEKANMTHRKLQSPNTAGYVGSIISSALSFSGCSHFPTVYGAYTGISAEHTIDISDDYEELSERKWFSSNIGKTFELKLNDSSTQRIQYTRSARIPINLGDDIELGDIQELEGIPSNQVEAGELKTVFEDTISDSGSSSSNVSTNYVFKIESVDLDDDEVDDDESEDESDDEAFAWATFKNVPVQLTIMEKLDGTLYDLFMKFPDTDKQFAWIAQVVFALAFAQRTFGLTHNDLHCNNIMYVPTTSEFFYYSHAGETYSVPTYGYLIKIIDFDRAIASIKIQGMKESRLFMSDQFHEDEEAGGQYNMEPFYNNHYQVIKPNPSFDLVRLATSIFWDLFPCGPKFDDYMTNPLFNLFVKWLTLPDGTSILFHKNNPKVDRYYGFDLYKAIARYCKDVIPRKELSEFKCFLGECKIGEPVLIIES
jgi:hypothetical protein